MDVSVGVPTMLCGRCTDKKCKHNSAPVPPPWYSSGKNLLIQARTHPNEEWARTVLKSFNDQLLQTHCFKVSITEAIVHDQDEIQEIIDELKWSNALGICALIDGIHFGLRGVIRTRDKSHYCTVNDEMMKIINDISLHE